MYKNYLIAIALAIFSVNASAQAVNNLSVSGLSETQKAELALKIAQLKEQTAASTEVVGEAKELLESISKFEGIGRETGIAVREALMAVTDVADKFAGTDVGRITIILVVWRVIGEDVLGLLFGIVVMPIGIYIAHMAGHTRKRYIEYDYKPMFWGLYQAKVETKTEVYAPTDGERWMALTIVAITFIASAFAIF